MTEQRHPVTEVAILDDVSNDVMLSILAKMAQENELGLSLTVNVAGVLYSGVLVGRDKWFDLITEQAASFGEGQGNFVGALRDAITGRVEPDDKDSGEAHEKPVIYAYLHMRDVNVFSGGQRMSGMALWRIRLSEVSAWMLGSWNPA